MYVTRQNIRHHQQVLDAIEENLPTDEDESEWNWGALATSANTRWGLNLRDRDLKKIGRENLGEELIKLAQEAIGRIDLSSCIRYLEPDFGERTACAWLHDKFGVESKRYVSIDAMLAPYLVVNANTARLVRT